MADKNTITDAVEIMHHLYIRDNPEALARLAEEEIKLRIAHHVYDLRAATGQTQEEFGALVGMDAIIIDALEESDYEGDSLAALAHIEKAFLRNFSTFIAPAKGVYPNALLTTTVTGFKLKFFRYHRDRTAFPGKLMSFIFEAKTPHATHHILSELDPWAYAMMLNRKELNMFAAAGITEWCHIEGGLQVNFTGNPAEYMHAVDTHTELINAIIEYLHTGQLTDFHKWREEIRTDGQARYLTELEESLHAKIFECFPDAEWLVQTLIGFVKAHGLARSV